MEVSGAKKLKTFEVENAKLKKLLAELMMDVSTLKEMLRKTSEARCATQSCKLGHDRETIPMLRDAPVSGLWVVQLWLRNCGPKPPLKRRPTSRYLAPGVRTLLQLRSSVLLDAN